MIYFDNAATTKPFQEVLDVYNKVNQEYWYNSASLYKEGEQAHRLLDKATLHILNELNSKNSNIIFTHSATEANNTAVYGIVSKYKTGRIITTKVEHPSVLNCFKDLEEKGYDVIYLDIDPVYGQIDYNQLEKSLNSDTILVSIMWVNNLIGSINDVNRIIKLVRKYNKCKLHIDGVQGIGKIPLTFNPDDVDLLTFSSHKIHGVKSVASLLYNKRIDLVPFLKGSLQQVYKSGTVDVAGAVSFAKSLEISLDRINNTYKHCSELKEYLISELSKIPFINLNLPKESSPYILNLSIKGVFAETIMHYLEKHDICVSISSACSSKLRKPERTVLEFTHDEELALSAIRLSFAEENTLEECQTFVDVIKEFK